MDTRRAMRTHLRSLRSALSDDARALADAAAQARVVALPSFISASRVALYRAYDGEVSTETIQRRAAATDKPALYARRAADGGLEFVEPVRWTVQANRPPYPHGMPVTLTATDLVVVPVVAFDDHGNRLGLGGGCYDRLLADCPASHVGIAYEIQRVEAVPHATWDQPLGRISTERALHVFNAPRAHHTSETLEPST